MYTTTNRVEQDPFLMDTLQTLRKRAWIIVLTALVFAGVAVGFSYAQTPTYEVSGQLLVGQVKDSKRVSSLGSDIMGLQQATLTVATAVDSIPVAAHVARKLNLHTDPEVLLKHLTVEQVQSTQFIQITYSGSDREKARKIVNAFGTVASERIAKSSAGASGIQASMWEFAEIPEKPVEPNPIRNSVLALGLGLMLGTGLAFLLNYLDDGWRSTDEVERILRVPTFGIVPLFDARKLRKMRST